MADLTFNDLTAANRSRVQRWHPGFPDDAWTGGDWANAMQGEAGEAGNIVKKLRRAELDLVAIEDPDVEGLLVKLGNEIADTLIYLDLLATYYGIELDEAVIRKFNAVSDLLGFPERLRADRG